MTVRQYSSSDASAPVLRGNNPGDYIGLLYACLVTGYGSKPGAGWTRPYLGTNVAVFRNDPTLFNGHYLRVDDTMVASGTAYRGVRVLGYETMSDVDTGTQRFPSLAQQSNPSGNWWIVQYNGATVANPRPWEMYADEGFFILRVKTNPAAIPQQYNTFQFFGEPISYKAGDTGFCVICNETSGEGTGYTSQNWWGSLGHVSTQSSSPMIWVPRRYDGLTGPVRMGYHTQNALTSAGACCQGSLEFPHGPDGGLYMNRLFIHDPTTTPYSIRGHFPGLWTHHHNNTIMTDGDTLTGAGLLAGRTFKYWAGGNDSGVLIETSDTWRT